jgi:sulfite reductase (NADPH) hemoprotein beta-component
MYRYDSFDQAFVDARVAQFRDQLARHLDGRLSDDDFKPLRLQNGLYIQRHGPMLRVAIPYGLLSATQLRKLAHVARRYDRGYGHFTTRQNIQFNWPKLEETGDILAELASVQMHAIQTSGNCVRNITADEFAGVAPDELIDPRALAEILRQWSTLHPEFAFLPRKFKVAVSGAHEDRAATAYHDIGLHARRDEDGQIVLRVLVGGGMGRTPVLAALLREDLPWSQMLTYIEAILRVYNRHGRRDNIYKARIKILVRALGTDEFRRQVEQEFAQLVGSPHELTAAEYTRVAAHFAAPTYDAAAAADDRIDPALAGAQERQFSRWIERNVKAHRVPGYRAVVLSLKRAGVAPGDASAEEMELIADWSERYGFAELRVSHEQNLILPDVRVEQLLPLWREARAAGLAAANIGLLTDMISCPGGDFCALANARSLPLAEAIARRFDDLDYLHDLGEIDLNISGCINSCGHHHAGHIGILGVDKDGSEFFQISIGGADGSRDRAAAVGRIIGPGFAADEVLEVIATLLATYAEQREGDERFIDTVARLGVAPFKARVYADRNSNPHTREELIDG